MNSKNDRQQLTSLIGSFRLTQCIYVAAKLNIGETLVNGPLKVAKLAKINKVNADALCRVLRYLSKFGVFCEVGIEVFAATELSELLLANHKYSLKPMAILSGEEFYTATSDLLDSVVTNKPCFDNVFGQDFWHYLATHRETATHFNSAMEKGSHLLTKQILSCYDFSNVKTLVDVGGGKGHVVAAILSKYANINGVVFDLPHLEADYVSYIKRKKLISRCKFIGGDFFTTNKLPRGNLYILKTVIHDWDDDHALEVLKLCSSSMRKTDKLLIIDRIVESNLNTNQNTYMWDIQMLAIHGGKERTTIEFNELLNRANLNLINKVNINAELYLLEAKLSDQ